ncbi:hypothetical protein AiwAL_11990 [Acidiphilium sp. AL]|uniref:Uncharacterized protein n=1 Tax=Acidiphilium iwatense TaxID=768198 RepID=A0ABS9E0W0_9PROT|nr:MULTISPECIES: hypothetical protein [Acidiphilium]MCF3947561.1 hypothetical protein [Acidiphilium iwatense]MCU4160822.1 hypothetical protein [Acidiphilium sp. AL]
MAYTILFQTRLIDRALYLLKSWANDLICLDMARGTGASFASKPQLAAQMIKRSRVIAITADVPVAPPVDLRPTSSEKDLLLRRWLPSTASMAAAISEETCRTGKGYVLAVGFGPLKLMRAADPSSCRRW